MPPLPIEVTALNGQPHGGPPLDSPAQAHSEARPNPRWQAGDWLCRVVIPAIVLAGALAKLFYGSPTELPLFIRFYSQSLGLGELRVFCTIVAVEAVCAVAMFTLPRFAPWIARALLAVFMAVLIGQLIDKRPNCGCFGALSIPVAPMLALESILFVLTFVLRRAAWPPASDRRWGVLTALAAAAIIVVFLAPRLGYVGLLRSDEDLIEYELLTTAQGRPFAALRLAKHTGKTPADFAEPVQFWVLYRQSCQLCHQEFRDSFSVAVPGQRVIAVEVPAYPPLTPEQATADATGRLPIECDRCEHLSLDSGRDWKIQTPIVLRVERGIVTKVVRRRE